MCVNFIHKWRDQQFKVDSERQIFWETFHGNFIYYQFLLQSAISWEKKYSLYFFWLAWGSNPGFTPTHYLLDYGDFTELEGPQLFELLVLHAPPSQKPFPQCFLLSSSLSRFSMTRLSAVSLALVPYGHFSILEIDPVAPLDIIISLWNTVLTGVGPSWSRGVIEPMIRLFSRDFWMYIATDPNSITGWAAESTLGDWTPTA